MDFKKIDILTSTLLIELDGEPHMLTTLIDITERKSIEEEHGAARYARMMRDLKNPQKILRTFNTLIPAFLDHAIQQLDMALAI